MSQYLNYSDNISTDRLRDIHTFFQLTDGMISIEEGLVLYSLASQVQSGCIVEVGSYRGRSTVFLGQGSLAGHGAPVYAIDPHKPFVGVLGGIFGPIDRTAFYKTMLITGCSEIVSLINLSSEMVVPKWSEPVALLWIDGDHSYAGVKRDFECWLPHVAEGACIAFDDSTDPVLGPRILINELLATQEYEECLSVGKVSVIKKKS
ncbi:MULTISPECIES: class I SAM-dependent methyltransferase [Pseudomonas]|jgi:hypothetical protein|uniref:Class I SAM-dependent methyltransferase n=1 Tax=Pseudomonas frederiksbergensis TaxID=104087 RepID=A0A6L5BV48_9PSED|nr:MULTISPECIES: class I SAM-dependent methyltransferase [Pseudomonas]KAF2391004.1 hypothetical protein FX983_05480 [Pseudomonas frederiksbergensis]MDN3220504.1 class I SAM-dependent methyltransferase [Pseudomonas nunensis]UZE10331.1 class I SAM-dependent methyltransferase [Pseudomonas sp. B21-053]